MGKTYFFTFALFLSLLISATTDIFAQGSWIKGVPAGLEEKFESIYKNGYYYETKASYWDWGVPQRDLTIHIIVHEGGLVLIRFVNGQIYGKSAGYVIENTSIRSNIDFKNPLNTWNLLGIPLGSIQYSDVKVDMFSNEETYQSNINAVVHRWHLRFWIPKFTLLTEAGSDRRKTSEPASGKTVRTQTTIVSAETNAKTQQFQKEYDNAKELWRKLWKEKKYTEMIEALQQVDESVRDYDYYSSYLEPTYFMAKQYENAILAYEKALTMATDKKQKGHCYTGIGTMYSWLDKTEEKIKYYRLGAELGDETAIKRLKEMEGGK